MPFSSPVLLVLSLSLASLGLHPIMKIGILSPSAVLICYLISHYVLHKIKWKRLEKDAQDKKKIAFYQPIQLTKTIRLIR